MISWKQCLTPLCISYSGFSLCFARIQLLRPYRSINMVTSWKYSRFIFIRVQISILVNDKSEAVHTLSKRVLRLFSVDEIYQLIYMNCSVNFKGLSVTKDQRQPRTWRRDKENEYPRTSQRETLSFPYIFFRHFLSNTHFHYLPMYLLGMHHAPFPIFELFLWTRVSSGHFGFIPCSAAFGSR